MSQFILPKAFPIPVVGIGPGSQPADPDLNYMPLPRELDGFDMPYLPTAEETAHLGDAKALVAELIRRMQAWDGTSEPYPSLLLNGLDSDGRTLISQLLGEGEVSARVRCLNGHELLIQESVFAGVWRVLETDADGQPLADRIEACAIPAAVWQQARAFGRRELTPFDPAGVALMNAPAVLAEVAERAAAYQDGAEDHVINFSLLPMTPEDLAYIDANLGGGNSGVFSRGYGKCRVMATGLQNVWRVQYFNGMNSILLDTLEITRMPEVALAAADDLADAIDRLQEALDWLTGEQAA